MGAVGNYWKFGRQWNLVGERRANCPAVHCQHSISGPSVWVCIVWHNDEYDWKCLHWHQPLLYGLTTKSPEQFKYQQRTPSGYVTGSFQQFLQPCTHPNLTRDFLRSAKLHTRRRLPHNSWDQRLRCTKLDFARTLKQTGLLQLQRMHLCDKQSESDWSLHCTWHCALHLSLI